MKKGQTSVRGGIQDILIPMEFFRCLQGDFEGNHPSYACDLSGKDTGRDVAYAPCDVVCVATNPNDGNTVWWQSQNKVRFADGTIDYLTMMIIHDNNLDGIYVGAKYNQGQQIAQEGTAGMANGNHLHIEVAKGKFTSKYAKNAKGYYLPKSQAIETVCFADGTTFVTSSNWNWKYTKDVPVANTSASTTGCPFKSSGAVKAIVDGIRVRTTPSTSQGDTGIKYNTNSNPLYYNRIVAADGWYWAEYDRSVGGKGYCALCKTDGTSVYWKQV